MSSDETEDDGRFTLSRPGRPPVLASEVYTELSVSRGPVVDTARSMAEVTIPSAFPPEGYKTGDPLPGTNQSASAGFVNGLAATLMFMAFPPGQPIFRARVLEAAIQASVDEDPELYSKVQVGLARHEVAHRELIAATPMATVYTEYMRQLLIGGNALWKHLHREEPMCFRADQYVVRRSAAGHPLVSILKETISLQTLSDDLYDFIVERRDEASDAKEHDDEVDIYSVCKLEVGRPGKGTERTWLYWEEWEGHVLPGTTVETPYDIPPMWPGWLIPVFGSNWGRGYCEEYRGDLVALDANWSALNDGSALAALALILVKNGGTTSLRQIKEVENLSVLSGDANDLSVFNSGKTGDLNWVFSVAEAIERRLGRVFLRQSSIQRSGERVTAEELRRLGNELDKALGGLYTQIAQGSQRRIITRVIAINEDEVDDIPKLPEGVVRIEVTTGVDALGNSVEYDNLMDYAQSGRAAFPQTFEKSHNPLDFFRRLAAAKGVKPDGLVLDDGEAGQQDAAAQQQAMMQTLMEKGAGPAVKGIADAINQQQQPTTTESSNAQQ